MKPLIDLHGKPKNWDTASPLYFEALADIPPELLALAVKHAIASNPFFPKPADLRLSIIDELREYRRRQDEQRVKMLPPPPETPKPTPEDIAHVEAATAKALAVLGSRASTFHEPRYTFRGSDWRPSEEALASGLDELRKRGVVGE